MIYVLLTDDDDGTAMIACPDETAATELGWAAVINDGGVSAWRVPDRAITGHERVTEILRDGGSCTDILDEALPVVPRA